MMWRAVLAPLERRLDAVKGNLTNKTSCKAKVLTIVVVEEDRDRAIAIVDALKDASDCDVFVIGNSSGLARRIAAHAPDVVLIDIDNPTRDAMEELTLASGPLERPVAMFVSGAAGGLAQAATEAGVSAYVVDGLTPGRIKPVRCPILLPRWTCRSKMRLHRNHELQHSFPLTATRRFRRDTIGNVGRHTNSCGFKDTISRESSHSNDLQHS